MTPLRAVRARLVTSLAELVNDSETKRHTDLIELLRDAVTEIDDIAGEDA